MTSSEKQTSREWHGFPTKDKQQAKLAFFPLLSVLLPSQPRMAYSLPILYRSRANVTVPRGTVLTATSQARLPAMVRSKNAPRRGLVQGTFSLRFFLFLFLFYVSLQHMYIWSLFFFFCLVFLELATKNNGPHFSFS